MLPHAVTKHEKFLSTLIFVNVVQYKSDLFIYSAIISLVRHLVQSVELGVLRFTCLLRKETQKFVSVLLAQGINNANIVVPF